MKAKYLGLDLSSPVVVSSSPYTATVSNIEQCVRNGAGAVVLKSIFEEQIIRHAAALDYASQQGMGDSGEYLERYIGDAYKGEFLKLVADARTTGVPVIASINCIASAEAWTDYAVSMEQAGAAALELNIFLQPTDRHRSAQELEQEYADVVRRVAEVVKIPVSVKLPMRLTNVLAVADSGNFSLAAQACHVGQPALSQQIAKLEKEMREASKMLEFEYAAVLRDRIIELRGEK